MLKKTLIKIRSVTFIIIYILFFPLRKIFNKKEKLYTKSQNTEQLKCEYKLIENRDYDLSIIIPVYNVEKYLKDCIESIIKNKSNKYKVEYIFVNDGSKDSSRAILKEYEKEENFIIIDKQNGGLSSARNEGIKISRGKKLFFIDSDDVLLDKIDDILDDSCRCASKIVSFNYVRFKDKIPQYFKSKELEEVYGKDKYINCISGYAWGKVYDYDLFSDVSFPNNYWYEDTINHFLLFPKCIDITYINRIIYGYRKNINSITSRRNKKNDKSIDTVSITKLCLDEYIKRYQLDEYIVHLILKQSTNITFSRIKGLEKEKVRDCFAIICDYIKLIDYKNISSLSWKEKAVIEAFENKNIIQWKILCRI